MKRFGKLAFLLFALYAATILFASYHDHHANTEQLNCKLCQINADSSDQVIQVKSNLETHDFGKLPEFESLTTRDGIVNLRSGRAPPTISL